MDDAAACEVALLDAGHAMHDAPCGEVGAAHMLHQVGYRGVRVVDEVAQARGDLAQVVRRDLACHADRDAHGAIAQEVGESRRQHRWLSTRLVVISLEVDRILAELSEDIHGRMIQAGLRVPHGGRWVSVDGSEVALAGHEGIAHAEGLREVDQRGIHNRLTVGVVVPRGVAGDLGAFPVSAPRRQAEVIHRHEDAPLRRLQSIPRVGQGALEDEGHRVGEEGICDFFRDVYRVNWHGNPLPPLPRMQIPRILWPRIPQRDRASRHSRR